MTKPRLEIQARNYPRKRVNSTPSLQALDLLDSQPQPEIDRLATL